MYQQRAVRWRVLLVPALLTTVAYVDPGNFGSNIEAGSLLGYDLLWVVVAASLAAAVIQYLAALLGLATGGTLASVSAQRMSRPQRLVMWAQAELVIIMTDLAELIGGALGLYLLFGIPLPLGACIVGVGSLLIMAVGPRAAMFSTPLTLGLLAVVGVGVIAMAAMAGVRPGALDGLVPGALDGPGLILVTAIVGATVMPHALYFHSAVSADARAHDRAPNGTDPTPVDHPDSAGSANSAGSAGRVARGLDPRRRLGWAIVAAMGVAGCVNGSLLVIGANLPEGTPSGIEAAHAALSQNAGQLAGILLGVTLLASGLASTVVGVFTGQVVMQGFIRRPIPLWVRRLTAVVPPLVVLAAGVDPTWALIVSQAVLALALPVTLVPLLLLVLSRRVMGPLYPGLPVRTAAVFFTALIIVMDVALIGLLLTGHVV
ncbi:manganese transport protein [Kineosphaera limosa]|uniref:Manganese transport protein n=1 Tax=Kineosphaera limosa NBRC 100340 TaxID=1184609 RepID=K6WC35_9MICO|nr:Nramp family divalent metal transporter [Kineosphaera limosa]NYE00695.1 manganese transport protein [Kineosphaera limosa]GAB96785.1 manganese transport protein [Kineosphaera limosa NBRC 100340]